MNTSMSGRRSPTHLVHATKQFLAETTGRILIAFTSEERVQRIVLGKPWATLFGRFILAGYENKLKRSGNEVELERSHNRFWQGDEALELYKQNEWRFKHLFLGEQMSLINHLRDHLQKTGRWPYEFMEIGCGRALVLDHIATLLPRIKRFKGVDINQERTWRNRMEFRRENVRFTCGDGVDEVIGAGMPNSVFFTFGGVYEYISETRLEQLFQHIATELPRSYVVLSEPVANEHDLETESGSLPYGLENSFSHNYPALLRSAGFNIIYTEEQFHVDTRWCMLIAYRP